MGSLISVASIAMPDQVPMIDDEDDAFSLVRRFDSRVVTFCCRFALRLFTVVGVCPAVSAGTRVCEYVLVVADKCALPKTKLWHAYRKDERFDGCLTRSIVVIPSATTTHDVSKINRVSVRKLRFDLGMR